MKGLHDENYEMLIKGIKDDLRKWKGISQSWIGGIIKMAILLKAMYRVNVIPTKCQMTIDRQMDKEDVVCTHTHTHTHTHNGIIAIKDAWSVHAQSRDQCIFSFVISAWSAT